MILSHLAKDLENRQMIKILSKNNLFPRLYNQFGKLCLSILMKKIKLYSY